MSTSALAEACLFSERGRRLAVILGARAEALEVVLGLGLVVVGVAMVSMAAALIVAGIGILTAAAWPARQRKDG